MTRITFIANKIVNYILQEYETKINKNKIIEILNNNKIKTETKEQIETIKRKNIKNSIKMEYMFRAESKHDVNRWIFNFKNNKPNVNIIETPDNLPDVEVEFTSELTIDELRKSFDTIIMFETLNYKDKYTGERYYNIDTQLIENKEIKLIKISETNLILSDNKIYNYLILKTNFCCRLLDSNVDNGEFKTSLNDLINFVDILNFGNIIGISDYNIYTLNNEYIDNLKYLKTLKCINNGCVIFKLNKSIIEINMFLYKYFNDPCRHCNMKYINFTKNFDNNVLYVDIESEGY